MCKYRNDANFYFLFVKKDSWLVKFQVQNGSWVYFNGAQINCLQVNFHFVQVGFSLLPAVLHKYRAQNASNLLPSNVSQCLSSHRLIQTLT